MRWILLIFVTVPLLEMLLLFEVAERIGGFTTLLLVVATAITGVQILRWQGLATLFRANQRMQSGQLPAQEVVEGMLLAASGALLLTPGFITDTLGFLLLTGPLRRRLAGHLLQAGFWRNGGQGLFQVGGRHRFRQDGHRVYEGEVDPDDADDRDDRRPGS